MDVSTKYQQTSHPSQTIVIEHGNAANVQRLTGSSTKSKRTKELTVSGQILILQLYSVKGN